MFLTEVTFPANLFVYAVVVGAPVKVASSVIALDRNAGRQLPALDGEQILTLSIQNYS